MLAAYTTATNRDEPLSALTVGDRPEPEPRPGWSVVTVKAATLNRHDLWSLAGVGLPDAHLPMILGCDAAGVDADGREVVVHSVIASPGWSGDETFDPKRSLLSETHQGTLAEKVLVPTANLVPKPESMSWETAACLPTAWLTAYRMVFMNSGAAPGSVILVQGAGGGVATAVIQLASAAGIRVFVTSRDEARREHALALGAEAVFESGARLPEKCDAVIDSVGAATWSHSVNVLRPGGTIVTCGATSGDAPPKAELTKIFFRQLRVIGSTMGNRDELNRLVQFMATKGIEPEIDSTYALADAAQAFARLESGDQYGKIVVAP